MATWRNLTAATVAVALVAGATAMGATRKPPPATDIIRMPMIATGVIQNSRVVATGVVQQRRVVATGVIVQRAVGGGILHE